MHKRKDNLMAWVFLLPALIMIGVFFIYPIIRALIWSVLDYKVIANTGDFVGLKNFQYIFADPNFYNALKNTFLYLLFVLPLNVFLPIVLAVLVNQKIRGTRFYRILYYLPVITPMVIGALVWKSMYREGGVVSEFFVLVRLFGGDPVDLLSNSSTALPAVAFITVWKGMGYYMMIYLAGLQAIPKDVYEAGDMDGTTKWQRLTKITIPMLTASITLVSIMTIIAGMKVFEEIQVTTAGGPAGATTTLVMYIYQFFKDLNYSTASAAGVILLVLSLCASLIQMRLNKSREEDLKG